MIFVLPHQGLGDHILCNAIYRRLSDKHRIVVILVRLRYYDELKYMLRDLPNVYFIIIPNFKYWFFIKKFRTLIQFLRLRSIRLGIYGEGFFLSALRFDNNFYLQAEMEFDLRWSNFKVIRNLEKENEVTKRLIKWKYDYIFLHEDISRGYLIDRSRIKTNLPIITPLQSREFSIFDYRTVIQNASEVHVIESSFAAYIDSLPETNSIKFAHRYTRPEAKSDYKHEFSYKNKWQILL